MTAKIAHLAAPSAESSSAHTPGPWTPLIQPKNKYFPKGSAMVSTGEGRMAIDCDGSADTIEGAAANARLIAAAPELLEALLRYVKNDELMNGDEPGWETKTYEDAWAAIAKATAK